MTRAEILNCLTDRPCDYCKFHESGRCERWDCVFEEEPDDAEEDTIGMTKEELARFINATKDKWHFTTESGKEVSAEQMLKALSAEPCEDTISRQAALDKAVYTETEEGWSGRTVDVKDIESLPPVTPIQKMGHWEWLTEDKYRCSNCNHETRVDECMNKPLYDFCPFCGAKMGERIEKE